MRREGIEGRWPEDGHSRRAAYVVRWRHASCCCRVVAFSAAAAIRRVRPPPRPHQLPVPQKGGGYYLDDGPGENPPVNLEAIADATPRAEPLHRGAQRPYTVMGRTYVPMTAVGPYRARGVASWYGRRYHGKLTSTGEPYDMYGMSAAHPTLPLPSYVRVTSVANGKSVIVRVNDRGPFIDSRLIDLSYTAAYKLGILAGGSAQVEVEAILPGAPASMASVCATSRPLPEAPAPAAIERQLPLAAEASGCICNWRRLVRKRTPRRTPRACVTIWRGWRANCRSTRAMVFFGCWPALFASRRKRPGGRAQSQPWALNLFALPNKIL